MTQITLRHGIFLPPFHPMEENPTACLDRDLELMVWLDRLGFHEAWIGEHHSAGFEIISSPEIFIAIAAERTKFIRFGTGDLSAILPGLSPCGRTNLRIKGWMGRADQTTKVKGMFVHPSQVAAIIARHREIVRGRLVVDNPDGADRMTLHVEVPARQSSRAEAIVASMREVTKLRGEVVFHAPGELPNDGKVIDDARKIG